MQTRGERRANRKHARKGKVRRPNFRQPSNKHPHLSNLKYMAEKGSAPTEAGQCGPHGKVVREIPVFLAQKDVASKSEVYIFNYPLRSPSRPYQLAEQCEAMRLKPNRAKAEIDIGLDTDGENYDPCADAQVMLKKQTLTSMSVPTRATYAVGLLKNNALHLVPVHAVVQMRPSMTYLDSAERAEASGKKPSKDDTEEEETTEEVTAVQVQFKRHETEREAERRLNSYAETKRKEDEEAWVELEVYGETSKTAIDMKTHLCQGNPRMLPFEMEHAEYLSTITPCNGTENILGADAGGGGLSRQYLNTLPLGERMRALFAKGQSQVPHPVRAPWPKAAPSSRVGSLHEPPKPPARSSSGSIVVLLARPVVHHLPHWLPPSAKRSCAAGAPSPRAALPCLGAMIGFWAAPHVRMPRGVGLQAVRYESLKRLAPTNTADDELVKALEAVANLVQVRLSPMEERDDPLPPPESCKTG
ncbi:hypothetical protein CYMTET_26075 [Cymbomonas tetramitiformis]|uniref:DNA-directed RNA polymerase III subunit Rpc5 n=1 Tax=Cymbomonas tetramitiformis TaxID=36881 RepID=A0AAE0FSZ3_9CHLO|nr:hypothetical protein CYMTET_26075 [Cymbomonas tetramitiformis]